MAQKNMLPIAVVVILVLAVGLGYFIFVQQSLTVGAPFDLPYQECTAGLEHTRVFLHAFNAHDIRQCMGTPYESLCKALISKDASLCGGVASCVAAVNNDPNACGPDDECRAFITGDSAFCRQDKITELDAYNQCVAFAQKNEGYYSSKEAKRHCLDVVYYQMSNSSTTCSRIENGSLKTACLRRFVR